MKHRPLLLLCVTFLSFTTNHAQATEPVAQTNDQKKAAQKMFEAGDSLYESARYEDAVEAFKQSHSLVNSPNSRLMLARSLRELGKTVEACAEFSETVRDAESSGGRYPETLQAATAEFAALKAQTTGNCAAVRPEESAAKVAAPARTATPTTPQTPTTPTEHTNPLRIAAWAGAGVGAAGALGFAVFGYLNHRTFSRLDEDCPNAPCNSNLSSRIDKGELYQTLANVSLGVAVLGAATATTLFIVSTPGSAEGPQLSLRVSPGSVLVDGRF